MLHTLATLALLAAPVLSSHSSLADIYVDVNAVNCAAGTGGPLDPVCSIGAAVVIASPGDTIHIAPGIYVESVLIGLDLDLISTDGADATIIDADGSNSVIRITNGANVVLDGLTLTNGRSTKGGGINAIGSITLRNSTVTGNRATELNLIAGCGGGIFCRGTSAYPSQGLTIENSTITNNSARGLLLYSTGGGIVTAGSRVTISDSTISGNDADWVGGLSVNTSLLDISNSTISGNYAYFSGGGMAATLGGPGGRISNSTVTENSVGPFGNGWGGIAIGNSPYAVLYPLEVVNTIIAGNMVPPAGFAQLADVSGPFTSLGHNLIGVGGPDFTDGVNGDQVGSQMVPLLAQLGPLSDNGGDTQTHEPLVGSLAIDAGDPANFLPLDQRGVARPLGVSPDVGAVESLGGFVSLCNGDGGDQMGCTNCPCMNDASAGTTGGCLNSASASARLIATGSPSVSLPLMDTSDLRFGITGVPPSAFCILNSGDGVAPSGMANPCFGASSGVQAVQFDGLRCAIMNTRRHGGRSADVDGTVGVTNSPWGGEGGPPAGIAVAGGGFASGQTRFFQVINRDDPLASCMRGLNTSQAVEVTFTP